MKDKFLFGFSSCPNDTFMFEGLVNSRVGKKEIVFEPHIADIEELNTSVIQGILDISKVSFAVYPEISENYQFLTSGSALGFKNGPLVVSKKKIYPDELFDAKIAIPGFKTTANLLLSILFPKVNNKNEYLFSDIEEAVLSNEADAGLIIHESRFTFQNKGLKLVVDLGDLWERKYNIPVPLGGIVIKRSLPDDVKMKVNMLIKKSIEFARAKPEVSFTFVKSNAKELSDTVIKKHIDLYVNEYSLEIGEEGRKAIRFLYEKGMDAGLFKMDNSDLFVN